MTTLLLIIIPLINGLASFFIKDEKAVKGWALFSASLTVVVSLITLFQSGDAVTVNNQWLPMLGSRFHISLDGMGKVLTLLTAIAYPVIFAATYHNRYKNAPAFYGFMLLSQAGLMGVFCSMDLLLFYFFWELALIPAYFLCSIWGGEKRIQVTFKFFIYTFVGSLLMLVGILFLYFKTAPLSFALADLTNVALSRSEENLAFWLFFIAFAIKMPVFPFHTWQPDTYEQSPTAVTMVLSGIMVKMGVFAVIRWLLPLFPGASVRMADVIMIVAIAGMLYASLIAIRQDDIKRLIAYSSIAHIGLMAASLFTRDIGGMQGVIFQMFAHGINIIGLWIVADLIEQQTGTRKFSELGGLAQVAPTLAILFVVMAFANIALPLTNSFVGEFLMFNSLFKHSILYAAFAGLSIILAAVYTLWMVQKVFYGNLVHLNEKTVAVPFATVLMLSLLVAVVIIFGVYPQPMFNLSNDTITAFVGLLK